MEKEDIENEIKELLKIRNKWCNTIMNKSKAYTLISEINIFKHTFSRNFPNSINHFEQNSSAEINFTDGISELKRYAESKLKVKDNIHFNEGIKNIYYGIGDIIIHLKLEHNME